MVDSGSVLIGIILVWYLIDLSQEPKKIVSQLSMVWIMSIVICNNIHVTLSIIFEGKSPAYPGCDHLHYLLLKIILVK